MRSRKNLVMRAAALLMTVLLVMAPCAAAMGSDVGNGQSAETKTGTGSAAMQEADTASTAGAEAAPEEEPAKEAEAAPAASGETADAAAPEEEPGKEPEAAPAAGGETADTAAPDQEAAEGGETKEAAAPALDPPQSTGEIKGSEEKEADAQTAPDKAKIRKTKAQNAVEEPDWLSGGTGSKKEITDKVDVTFGTEIRTLYREYGMGNWATASFDVACSGIPDSQYALCLDPLKNSVNIEGKPADHVYEYSTPMLVKAMYYGVGPGNSVLEEIIAEATGSRENLGEICNIVTHVSLSQVFAKLHEADSDMGSVKSYYGDGLIATSDLLVELVGRFGSRIAGLPVPDNYYVYVAALDDSKKQDFGFGAFAIRFPEAEIRLKKSASEKSVTEMNRCYSLAGAEYGVYTDAACTQLAGTLRTGEDGTTDTIKVSVGDTYYIKEHTAPEGYCLDPEIYEITPSNDQEVCTLEMEEEPAVSKISIEIWKKSRESEPANAVTPEGTEFTIRYFDGYYEPDALPDEAARTWVIRVRKTEKGYLARMCEEDRVSGEFYKMGGGAVIPLGTIAITESKAAEGFVNDGEFGEGIRTFVGQVRMNEEKNAAEMIAVCGRPSLQDPETLRFEVEDTPVSRKPEIRTTAADRDTGTHMGAPDGTITIDDTVSYRDLNPGEDYWMKGRLIDRSTRSAVTDKDGREVTAEKRFTAAASGAGSVVMTFTFEAGESLGGKTLVVYETAVEASTGITAAQHENPEDEAQSIHFPEGSTTAQDNETGTHTACPDEKVVIRDTIVYKNLLPGRRFKVEGVLVDAETGEPVIADGQKVMSAKEFTPREESGSVTVTFEFNGTALAGRRTVVFEKVKLGDIPVIVHEDLTDEGQSIVFPSVGTRAEDPADGDRTLRTGKNVKVKDTVRFTNLTPGREYILKGTLMDKKTGGPLRVSGDIVTGEKTFVPDQPDGRAQLEIRLDASALQNRDLVFFEDLFEVNPKTGRSVKIGSHRDLNDSDQTLHFTEDGRPDRSADTGDGSDPGTVMAAIFLSAVLLAAAALSGKEKEE